MSYKILTFLIVLFCLPAWAEEIVDLTHSFNEKTIYWPTNDHFHLNKVFAGVGPEGYFHAGYAFSAPEHGGTHIDAPFHFSEKGETVDQIPINHLMGLGVVIDVSKSVGDNAGYEVSVDDIKKTEVTCGALSSENIVLIKTGWSRFWGDSKKYMGSDKQGDTSHLAFPGLSKAAADYLVSKKIKGVGLDTASLDSGISKDFMAHRILLGANIYGLENLSDLSRLPLCNFKLIVAPMKIEGGTGAPVRVLAEIKR